MHRSHKTQELLNYFDEKDSRVRENPFTIDAQLLNTVAVQLEDSEQRLGREAAARTLGTCPVRLDNNGVYRAVRLANDFVLVDGQSSLTVRGKRNGTWVSLGQFDDRLPVPAEYLLDTARSRVPMSSPIVLDVTGPVDVKVLGPAILPIPNRLTFWVDGTAANNMVLDITIEGERYPRPVWMDRRTPATENLLRSHDGVFTTRNIWQSVSRITVRGLPTGVRLRCWQMPFNLPAVLDPTRPYTLPVYRDVSFDRYWQLSPNESLLKETFLMDDLSGLEYVQSYGLSIPLRDIAVEPRTWGLLACADASLYYADRREPMPSRLEVTALTREPLYGLDCSYDITKAGPVRYALLRAIPYGGASGAGQWRYIVEDPQGNIRVLLPDGRMIAYSGGAGWQRGVPSSVSVPLVQAGTYVMTLECLDGRNLIVTDSFPYQNLAFSSTRYDLSALVPEIAGVAFDAMEGLWVWTGDEAVPVRPCYDAYVLDSEGRTLYVTGDYDEIQYE